MRSNNVKLWLASIAVAVLLVGGAYLVGSSAARAQMGGMQPTTAQTDPMERIAEALERIAAAMGDRGFAFWVAQAARRIDALPFIRRDTGPHWSKDLLYPLARGVLCWRSKYRDEACHDEQCNCVWCSCRRQMLAFQSEFEQRQIVKPTTILQEEQL